MTTPEIAICQKGEMCDDRQRVLDDAEEQRAEHGAGTVPMPPAIETPPMTQAAMTSSSKPLAIST